MSDTWQETRTLQESWWSRSLLLLHPITRSGRITAVGLALLACISAAAPLSCPLAVGIAALLLWFRYRGPAWYPLKRPMALGGMDPNEFGWDGRPRPAKGIAYIGDDCRDGSGVWLSEDDMRGGLLVTGPRGKNKDKTLLGLAANALSWGSGFIWIGTGFDAAQHYESVFDLCAAFGRTQDLLVLDFTRKVPKPSIAEAKGPHRLVSEMTLNPLRTGSHDALFEMLVPVLVPSLPGLRGRDESIWVGHRKSFLKALLKALCWMRDNGKLHLDLWTLRDHLAMHKVVEIASGAHEPYMHIPYPIRGELHRYLRTLPGYNENRGSNQSFMTRDHHDFGSRPLSEGIDALGEIWPGALKAGASDVDLLDVISNRRILLVLLPWPRQNIGALIVELLRSAIMDMARGNTAAMPSPASRPSARIDGTYLAILDAYESYLTPGMAAANALARHCGLSMIYATTRVETGQQTEIQGNDCVVDLPPTRLFLDQEMVTRSGGAPPPDQERPEPTPLGHLVRGGTNIRMKFFAPRQSRFAKSPDLALSLIRPLQPLPLNKSGTGAEGEAA